MQKSTFTKQELSEHLEGISLRTIQYYTDQGIIIPGIANPKGRGVRRLYSAQNAIEFQLIGILSTHGITLQKIGDLFQSARKSKLDERWDPEGVWATKTENANPQMIILDAFNDPKIEVVGFENLFKVIRPKGLTTLIVNLGILFEDFETW